MCFSQNRKSRPTLQTTRRLNFRSLPLDPAAPPPFAASSRALPILASPCSAPPPEPPARLGLNPLSPNHMTDPLLRNDGYSPIPAVATMSRQEASPPEGSLSGPPFDFLIFPFADSDLECEQPPMCLPKLCVHDKTERNRCLCSWCCGPCQLAISFRRAGKSKGFSAAMGCVLGTFNVCAAEANRSFSLFAAGTPSGAALSPGALCGICSLASTAACISAAVIARELNAINRERGGPSSFYKLMAALWCSTYCPLCVNYQLSRAVDPKNEGWF